MTIIVALDPSGNHKEGKGTTGIAVLDNGTPLFLDQVKAENFETAEEYWSAIINKVRYYEPNEIVFEGYRLYNHKGMAADTQANSELETPQLIGVLKWFCHFKGIKYHVQFANEVKTRWNDDVLVRKGYLDNHKGRFFFNGEPTNNHKRDALRHGLHHWRYKHGHNS